MICVAGLMAKGFEPMTNAMYLVREPVKISGIVIQSYYFNENSPKVVLAKDREQGNGWHANVEVDDEDRVAEGVSGPTSTTV